MEQTTTQNSIALYLDNNQVEAETKSTLLQSFEAFFTQAQEWKDKASGLVITSVDQKEEIKQAKEARIALKNIRVNTEHKRKELKEESLRKGQTIDAIAKIITNEILPIEEHLEKQEKFAELEAARIKAELQAARETELAKYDVEGQFYQLGSMPEETYAQLLGNSKIAFDAKVQAALVAEAERIANEKAEAERLKAEREAEAERIRLQAIENERLNKELEAQRKEADKAKAAVEKERQAAEKRLEVARKESERIAAIKQAELDKAKAELEKKQLEEENERLAKIAEQEEKDAKAKALLLAPDKEKVRVFFEQFKQLQFPQLESEAGKAMTLRINEALTVVKQVIIQDSKTLI